MKRFKMPRNEYPGRLIVFEGVDGAGKTTLLNKVGNILNEKGIRFYATKTPSDRIRRLEFWRNFHRSSDEKKRKQVSPLSLTILVCGDRLIVQELEIIPALARGDWVLCDRYIYTGLTICSNPIVELITEKFLQPDIVFLAVASEEIVEERIKERIEERDRFYDRDLVRKRKGLFNDMAEANGFVRINTEESNDNICKKLENEISKLIAKTN